MNATKYKIIGKFVGEVYSYDVILNENYRWAMEKDFNALQFRNVR
jgi:hypothetical protein